MTDEIREIESGYDHLRVFVSLDNAEINKANGWEPTEERFWFKADVKWDGCVHLWRRYNNPEGAGDDDYMHICDLDEFIEWLQEVRKRVAGWKEWE